MARQQCPSAAAVHPAVVDILQYVVVLALVFVVSLMASVLAIVYSAWVRHFSSSWMRPGANGVCDVSQKSVFY